MGSLTSENQRTGLRYYFSFSNGNSTSFPGKIVGCFLKKGFRHVEMITELDNGNVMHINPRLGGVEHGITGEIKLHEILTTLKGHGHVIVMYRCGAPDLSKWVFRGHVMTCASYLAYTIGLPFHGCTPYALLKTLLKNGGTVI